MATFTAYTPFAAYDMSAPRIDFSFVRGATTALTPTYMQVADGARIQEYFGTGFAQDASGHFTSGTLTRTNYWVNGILQYTIDGLGHSMQNVLADDLPFGPYAHVGGGLLFYLFDGNDYFTGSSGNDVMDGCGGNDTLDGGGGTDTALFGWWLEDFQITKLSSGYSISIQLGQNPRETDTLLNIERAGFVDYSLAFDLGPGQAAGNTVRIIGAAFDALPAQQYRWYVDSGLKLFDSGMSMGQVCELVAQQLLQMNNETFVNTVYTNVLGIAPTPSERAYWVGQLQGSGGTMTQGQLLEFAANCEPNAVNIDLAGLLQTGVEYVPYPW